ncbi:thioredoxin family protein [Fulvivirga lutimaris]|uniref:thioredoxin family protein n=1 Tax=Fulvivirga lutimaris TaxID=1819566 RepID=UPI0012BD8279|nr:thioredoxin family protein [Fulvivirga lutimaris]MTI40529.1 thioredoxin family protein [Fulvivirga lutimaris]
MNLKTTSKPSVINEVHWENGLTYHEYRQLIDSLLKINQTTGNNHSEKQLVYTRLNVQRMNKWDKITKLNADLIKAVENINTPQKWLILTEAWCGDAAQNLPAIQKIADLNDNIEVRYLLRDENLDIMDAYLTDGSRSIPKLIILDNELTNWGPRPAPAQQILKDYKKDESMSYDQFSINLHTWYAKDKGKTLQSEFISLLASLG